MATELLGQEMVITYSGETIAYVNSFSFEVNKETIDVTTLDAGGWRKLLAGEKSFTASFDGLVTRGVAGSGKANYDELIQELKTNDTPVTIAVNTSISGDNYEEGSAILTGLSMSGGKGEAVTYSGSLEGTGALTTQTVA